MASPVQRGATYRGTGRQPNVPVTNGGSNWSFIVQFRVARDGRWVTQLHVWGLGVPCKRPAGSYLQPEPSVSSARIRRDGTFRVDMKPTIGTDQRPVTLTGRFLSQGRARGTLRYRGRDSFGPCNADGIWTARVKPPPPPVQHFAGTNSEGTSVTFERTIERHPNVTRFDFGLLRAKFPDGVQCGPLRVATGKEVVPPFDQFALPVKHGSFSGNNYYYYYYYYTDIGISGRFDAKDQATGTVSYGDRGDCQTGNVHWTAHRTG